MPYEASYIALARTGELENRAATLEHLQEECHVCPCRCGVHRNEGQKGNCGASKRASLISAFPHRGEEKVISGQRGSGTMFFGHCNLRCVFCQNSDISQSSNLRETECDPTDLAGIMLGLQEMGCHNVNWVSPTHSVAAAVRGLCIAAAGGFYLPIVYNSNGYDSLDVLKLLDGIVDIYMPDLKYADDGTAEELSGVLGYVKTARAALTEMHRQVGPLRVLDGVAVRGLLVRHLLLPNDLSGLRSTVDWIADNLGPDTTLNVMGQYHPAHLANLYPELTRQITPEELADAVGYAKSRLTSVMS